MERQEGELDASHGEALDLDAKAARIRQAVEDVYRVALSYQETVDGILLQARPSISWDTVSGIEARRKTGRVPPVLHEIRARDALTAEGERKIRKTARKLVLGLVGSNLVDATFPAGDGRLIRVRSSAGDYGEAFAGYVVQAESSEG